MTLSEFSYNARVFTKLGGVFAVLVIVAYIFILVVFSVTKRSGVALTPQEQQQQAMQTAFGKIEPVIIEHPLATEKLSFVLDTIDNALPSATSEANIYFYPEGTVTLTNVKQVEAIARNFGFSDEVQPVRVNDNTYRYEDDSKQLIVDQRNFHYTFSFKNGPSLQQSLEATPSAQFTLLEEKFTSLARDMLMKNGSYGRTLAGGKTNTVYLIYDLAKQEYVPVKDDTQPQAVRVDFSRVNVNGFLAVSPYYFTSQNYAILAPLTDSAEIVQMEYKEYPELEEGSSIEGITSSYPGVYPLMSIEDAWQALQDGKVSTVSLTQPAQLPIKIRDIFVAYYDPETYQKYMQPIYVFLGSDNFVGYLPAVSAAYRLEKGE